MTIIGNLLDFILSDASFSIASFSAGWLNDCVVWSWYCQSIHTFLQSQLIKPAQRFDTTAIQTILLPSISQLASIQPSSHAADAISAQTPADPAPSVPHLQLQTEFPVPVTGPDSDVTFCKCYGFLQKALRFEWIFFRKADQIISGMPVSTVTNRIFAKKQHNYCAKFLWIKEMLIFVLCSIRFGAKTNFLRHKFDLFDLSLYRQNKIFLSRVEMEKTGDNCAPKFFYPGA